jgi:hypothetical protein
MQISVSCSGIACACRVARKPLRSCRWVVTYRSREVWDSWDNDVPGRDLKAIESNLWKVSSAHGHKQGKSYRNERHLGCDLR